MDTLFQAYQIQEIIIFTAITSTVLWKVFPTASAYKWIILTAILTIGFNTFYLNGPLSDKLLSFGMDMIYIAILSFIGMGFNSRFVKYSYIITLLIFSPFLRKSFTHKILHIIQQSEEKINSSYHPKAELIIQLKNKHAKNEVFKKYGSQINSITPYHQNIDAFNNYYLLDLKNDVDVNAFDEVLDKNKKVIWSEPNQRIAIPQLDASKLISGQKRSTHQSDPMSKKQWPASKLNYANIHRSIGQSMQQTSDEVLLCILDTGVDGAHEDLGENYKSLDQKWDKDISGHGTHCAGVAAGVSMNGIGIISPLPRNTNIKIGSVKVLNDLGFAFQSSLIDGVLNAINHDADVISLSLGAIANEEFEKAYKDVFDYALSKNVIIVVAAGNASRSAKMHTPANVKGVIAVGAIDQNYNKASFTNTLGEIEMGIYAPGVNIFSTLPQSKYGAYNGTSMATPLVSSIAAIAKAINKNISQYEYFKLIEHTAIERNGIKIINPEKAIQTLVFEHQ